MLNNHPNYGTTKGNNEADLNSQEEQTTTKHYLPNGRKLILAGVVFISSIAIALGLVGYGYQTNLLSGINW